MPLLLIMISAASLIVSGNAVPEAAPLPNAAAGIVRRLSPEDAEAVKEAAARRNTEGVAIEDRQTPDGRIHGEVGFGIGTGGYRSVFGAAIVPLGDNGVAAFSFEQTNFGRRRYRY